MNEMLDQFMTAVSVHAPRVLAALAILVVGWILAHLLSRGLRKLLRRSRADIESQLAGEAPASDDQGAASSRRQSNPPGPILV